jgi:hypothetical protein
LVSANSCEFVRSVFLQDEISCTALWDCAKLPFRGQSPNISDE